MRKYLVMLFTLCNLAIFGCTHSPLVTGKWKGNTFTNEWTDITFEQPHGFHVLRPESMRLSGWVQDFMIKNEVDSTVISLKYTDISHKNFVNYTAEDYVSKIIQKSLLNSTSRNFTFSDSFERKTIAGREFAVMRGAYTYKDNPSAGASYDIYAWRYVRTMVVFIAVYGEGEGDAVDSFLSSISQTGH